MPKGEGKKANMRMKKPVSIGLVSLLLLSIATVMVPLSVSADEHPAQAFWVDPGSYLTAPELDNLTECDTFTVDVMINITDPDGGGPLLGLAGFDYTISWDNNTLNLTSYTIHGDTIWANWFSPVEALGMRNATHANHQYAVSALAPIVPFVGVVSLCTYTFHVNYQPHYPEPDYIGSLDIYNSRLADDKGDPIAHTTYDGQYRIPRPPIYSLEITTEGDGTTDPTPGTYIYEVNSTVQVTAIPYLCHLFDHWELDGFNVGSANPYSVLMDGNHTLHAVFVARIHDVAVTNVTPSKTIVGQGYSTSIKVTVENQGECPETFDVTTYYDDTPIETKTVTNMPPGEETTITFTWNTTGVPYGNYTIKAVADVVTNETDTDDNTYIDGIVTVRSPIYDVAVTEVAPSKTVIGQGFTSNITVTAENQGDSDETFNVSIYANTTKVETQGVTLASGSSTTITFMWNTTGFAKGHYTISVNATIVPGETDIDDNNYTDGTVIVSIPGDIRPEFGIVDIYDLVYVAIRYDSERGKPPPPNTQPYEPNADINGDDIIDIYDIVIIGIHYGETDC